VNKEKINTWVQFIGSVRSGHTLVSQIINAHKDALISDECYATSLYDFDLSRDNVLDAIKIKNEKYVSGGCVTWEDSYNIGHFQDRTVNPTVIGDKMCGGDTSKFDNNGYLDNYMKFIGLPFKFIWVLREPQQNINGKLMLDIKENHRTILALDDNIDHFKLQYAIAKSIEEKHDVLRVYLDSLIANPEEQITRMLTWLGLSVEDEHINACKKIIFDKPHTHEIAWTQKQLDRIKDEIKDYKENKI
jgi:hypothetical protein